MQTQYHCESFAKALRQRGLSVKNCQVVYYLGGEPKLEFETLARSLTKYLSPHALRGSNCTQRDPVARRARQVWPIHALMRGIEYLVTARLNSRIRS